MRKVNKKTNVILVKRMKHLGGIGDVVSVRVGYAKNYLLPEGIALRASEENLEYFNSRRAHFEQENENSKKEAEVIAAILEGHELVIVRMASENGNLYGSVTQKDVADELSKAGIMTIPTSSNQIELNHSIKTIGYFEVQARVHPDVVANIYVNIARTREEAVKQSEAYLRQKGSE